MSLVGLVVLCIVMASSSYLFGVLPLYLHLSEGKLELLSVFGGGLLMGTVLNVILPEGIDSIYNIGHQEHSHDFFFNSYSDKLHPKHIVATTLSIGILFMFAVDLFSKSHIHHQLPHSSSEEINLEDTEITRDTHNSATLGLLVHSAADGVAVGAAAASGESRLEFVVFLAVILHKAPSAFGLASFLLKSGLERSKIKYRILAFSFAAPITAFLTSFLIEMSSATAQEISQKWSGILLLFSAGTFLYVATMHVLPQIQSIFHFLPNLKTKITIMILFICSFYLPSLISVHHH